MNLRQSGKEMQNATENQATTQVSQLAQMKGKQPHGYKKIHALHQDLVSSTFDERVPNADSQDQKRL